MILLKTGVKNIFAILIYPHRLIKENIFGKYSIKDGIKFLLYFVIYVYIINVIYTIITSNELNTTDVLLILYGNILNCFIVALYAIIKWIIEISIIYLVVKLFRIKNLELKSFIKIIMQFLFLQVIINYICNIIFGNSIRIVYTIISWYLTIWLLYSIYLILVIKYGVTKMKSLLIVFIYCIISLFI